MLNPKVTVLMAVYNGEQYLQEAIESILGQTYKNFELLIINDASTDSSNSIIASYKDKRIRLINNETNLGAAAARNKGLEVASGEYIAIMDCDDISLPDRLIKQIEYLNINNEFAGVAANILLISSEGAPLGSWEDDKLYSEHYDIRRRLVKRNCIAHSTIMLRAKIYKQCKYDECHPYGSEDYDLWLQLCLNDLLIGKIPEQLLKYRIHSSSITTLTNQKYGSTKKYITTKSKFLWKNFKYCHKPYYWMVLSGLVLDLVSLPRQFIKKDKIKSIMYCIIDLLVSIIPVKQNKKVFCFFPFYHTGGAEKVHAFILKAIQKLNPAVFITNHSKNDCYKATFYQYSDNIKDISFIESSRILSALAAITLAAYINRYSSVVVLGANSVFFYRVVALLDEHVKKVDLVHAFGGGIEDASKPYITKLDTRIIITPKTYEDLREQYNSLNIDREFLTRIQIIENCTVIPKTINKDKPNFPLRVLYVGRGSPEKRVHLASKIISVCKMRGLAIEADFIGDVYNYIDPVDLPNCNLVGEILDFNELIQIYKSSHVLLLTSSREGFPMVVMEAMAWGVIPLCTDVGGIGIHINHGQNGFLISKYNEQEILNEAVSLLENIVKKPDELTQIALNAHYYAKKHFDYNQFREKYNQLLGKLLE